MWETDISELWSLFAIGARQTADQCGDPTDDLRIGRAERQSFEVADLYVGGGLDHRQRGRIVGLADIGAHDVGQAAHWL